MNTIVIIGQGQLGTQLSQRFLSQNYQVTAVSRTDHRFGMPNYHHIQADLDSLSSSLDLPGQIDCLYYLAPPSDNNLTDLRLARFLAHHENLSIKHIIYISTSGVYGSSNGKWITEETPVRPKADRAKRRLDAEHQLLKFQQQTNTPITILRCAAIYSSKTVNQQRIAANTKPVITPSQAPFTNRIHLDDLTEVCVKAKEIPPNESTIYNVSDGHPTTTTEHSWLLSDLANVERNKEVSLTDAKNYYSEAYMSYLNESKRLDISKLKAELKPQFKFENIIDGINDCLSR